VKEHLELRLQETLEEAKRHHNSYISIRDQYNNFIEGRVNQMVEACLKNPKKQADPSYSIKSNKAKADIIQTLKVNLEAQQE
jgi:hypothetical protein